MRSRNTILVITISLLVLSSLCLGNPEKEYAEEKGVSPDIIQVILNYDDNKELSATEKSLIDELTIYPEDEQKQILDEFVGEELTDEDIKNLQQFKSIYEQNSEFALGMLADGITEYEKEFMEKAFGADKDFLKNFISCCNEINEEELTLLEKASQLYSDENKEILNDLMKKKN